MAAPKVGDELINDAGTHVSLTKSIEGVGGSPAGTFPVERAGELIAAGYRPVKKGEEIPLQQHEVDALKGIDQSAG